MKGDFTKITFNPEKNYSSVRMQQGRVLLDSDWNEQADIVSSRIEKEAQDIIGRSGGPIKGAGFRISSGIADLTVEEYEENSPTDAESLQPGDFIITRGRYYLDGLLIENHHNMAFSAQKFKPNLDELQANGIYLIYLDVWRRHVSTIEEPSIREVALGGPDTTTRYETVWQVKARRWLDTAIFVNDRNINNCENEIDDLLVRGKGRLSTEFSEESEDSLCSMASRGGYQGLENHLYRVEIHDGGQLCGWRGESLYDTSNSIFKPCNMVNASSGEINASGDHSEEGVWKAGQFVEVFSLNSPAIGILARIERASIIPSPFIADPKYSLKLNKDLSALDKENLRILHVASFKWSRDNGSVAFAIESPADDSPKAVKVKSLGRDKTLSLQGGDWVEVLDDTCELRGQAGTLATIPKNGVDEANRVITLSSDVSGHKNEPNPRIRKWNRSESADPSDLVNPVTQGLINLEYGIGLRFSSVADSGDLFPPTDVGYGPNIIRAFRTGDYWTFYARSIKTLQILSKARPEGIDHHYCSLALIRVTAGEDGANKTIEVIRDCRKLFPAATEHISLFYLGGDGQEAKSDGILDEPLRVGVSRGQWPLPDPESRRYRVQFSFADDVSSLNQGYLSTERDMSSKSKGPLILPIEPGGIVQCWWQLGSNTTERQGVEAKLVDAIDHSVHFHLPIRFAAKIPEAPIASDISYISRDCSALQDTDNVQQAIDQIHHLASLYYSEGNGQEALRDPTKPDSPIKLITPLTVMVANDCGPISGALVEFEATNGFLLGVPGTATGSFTSEQKKIPATTKDDGLLSCYWILDGKSGAMYQEVVARLTRTGRYPIHAPTSTVRFTARLNSIDAGQVSISPNCRALAGTRTVQEAVDKLCSMQEKEPSIHITKIQYMADDEKTFANLDIDSSIRADQLAQGVYITFDGKIDPNSIEDNLRFSWKSNCLVILDLPYTLGYDNEAYFGTTPVTLKGSAEVLKDNQNIIKWTPSDDFSEVFLRENIDYGLGQIWQAHLLLKGRSIWSQDGLYLDGETLVGSRGLAAVTRRNMLLPSGDGERGGDFEMSFRVTPCMALEVVLDPFIVAPGGSTKLTTKLGISAPAKGAIISLTSSNQNVFQVPQTLTIAANASSSVPIEIKAAANITAETRVSIRAVYRGVKAEGTLIVRPRA
ncbi:Uncharacterised protein [uncultured archaeon]|nr:Uncharacterised protein [uncultured archaeon]